MGIRVVLIFGYRFCGLINNLVDVPVVCDKNFNWVSYDKVIWFHKTCVI